MLVVGGDDDHDGQRPLRQSLDHVEPAQSRHLEIQQHKVRLETLDLDQGIATVGSLADHLDISTECSSARRTWRAIGSSSTIRVRIGAWAIFIGGSLKSPDRRKNNS